MNNKSNQNHIFKAYPFNPESSDETMLDFLKSFDALYLKYAKTGSINDNSLFEIINLLSNFEETYQYGELTKQKYSSIEDNLRLVYGDNNIVHNDVLAYHLTEKKIIHQYLAIPELDKMFDEDYFNFEWDIHAGQNFSEHRNDYNRDHFIHQIRNMYMMMVFLDKYNFFDAAYNIFSYSEKKSGKIIEFVQKKQQEFLNDNGKPYFKLFNDISDRIENFKNHKKVATESIEHFTLDDQKNIIEDLTKAPTTNNSNSKSYDFAKFYFMKYVIYASCILSALFHDMGYPICYFLEMRHRVSEYNPTLYMFTHNAIDSFDQLEAKLSNSLLFTVVSIHEIKKSLQINKKGKYNHGAYSAIAFLLQFYNTGIIHSLSAEKRCAIELAALAIYNHTLKYNCINREIDNNYYQPSFRQNPISFLLRLCDDIQEWDRRYFEISTDSDLSICPNCFTPPLYIPNKNTANNGENNNVVYSSNYKLKKSGRFKCYCEKSSFRYDSFLKRKIYVVTVADSVETNIINSSLCISINYDLYKLLKMSRVNNTYAKFRLNELNDLKKLLQNQNFNFQSNNFIKFKYMYLNYFMTSNPITIKIKILENYLLNRYGTDYESKISSLSLDDIFSDVFGIEELQRQKQSSNNLYSYLKNASFDFYKELLILAIKCRNDKNVYLIKGGMKKNTKLNNNINTFINTYTSNPFVYLYSTTMDVLIKDCLCQYSKEIDISKDIDGNFMSNDLYYEQYAPEKECEDLVYNAVAVYCNSNNYFNQYYTSKHSHIGYYADLYLFDRLNEKSKINNTLVTDSENK